MAHTSVWTGLIMDNINKNKGMAVKLSPQLCSGSHVWAPVVILCCLSVALKRKCMQYEGKIEFYSRLIYVCKYKVADLKSVAVLHVCHMFSLSTVFLR